MSGRLKSVYGSGWSPAKKAMLDQVVIPEKYVSWSLPDLC